ncbi:TIGR00266 family protein [Nonomuraea sediminis]|uniref:TIGR00266 family protein n=1 Tax=Nonomuraea sediminis TaxID=2835864 RepID=UPI001BDC83BE|nr:TIGR00266 family protein [Nonomuraea sediminis]
MKTDIRHGGSFAVARCHLAGGESVRVESGAMSATSAGVQLQAKMEGGLLRGLARSALGGESLFTTRYTAPQGGGWVDVAHHLPGDVVSAPVQHERALLLTRGSWIASSDGVEIVTKWGGMSNLIGGEGGFLIRAEGDGEVILGCYGALDWIELAPGETIVVDTGHLVAYDETVRSNLRRAVEGKTIQSLKSGEGLVFDFTGPGRVLTQTRNPSALISWLTAELPFKQS